MLLKKHDIARAVGCGFWFILIMLALTYLPEPKHGRETDFRFWAFIGTYPFAIAMIPSLMRVIVRMSPRGGSAKNLRFVTWFVVTCSALLWAAMLFGMIAVLSQLP